MVTCLIFFLERIMLNDIFWDKSHCDGLGLKSFPQFVSLISKLKVCLQKVYNIGGMSALFAFLVFRVQMLLCLHFRVQEWESFKWGCRVLWGCCYSLGLGCVVTCECCCEERGVRGCLLFWGWESDLWIGVGFS